MVELLDLTKVIIATDELETMLHGRRCDPKIIVGDDHAREGFVRLMETRLERSISSKEGNEDTCVE